MITNCNRLDLPENWIIVPGGLKGIFRHAYKGEIPDDLQISSLSDWVACMHGYQFPWGRTINIPDGWEKEFRGVTGLYHHNWYVFDDNSRIGGAWNVNRDEIGRMRYNSQVSPGYIKDRPLAENEGYCIVKPLSSRSSQVFCELQDYAAKHINPDEGLLYCSPLFGDDENKIYVGLVGQCLNCRRKEITTIPQLQKSFPKLEIEIFPDLQGLAVA